MNAKPPFSAASVADNPSALPGAGKGGFLRPDAYAPRGDTPADTPNLGAALPSIGDRSGDHSVAGNRMIAGSPQLADDWNIMGTNAMMPPCESTATRSFSWR
jgi:hypothetical protein